MHEREIQRTLIKKAQDDAERRRQEAPPHDHGNEGTREAIRELRDRVGTLERRSRRKK